MLAGATIVSTKEAFSSDIILKVRPPAIPEVEAFKPGAKYATPTKFPSGNLRNQILNNNSCYCFVLSSIIIKLPAVRVRRFTTFKSFGSEFRLVSYLLLFHCSLEDQILMIVVYSRKSDSWFRLQLMLNLKVQGRGCWLQHDEHMCMQL